MRAYSATWSVTLHNIHYATTLVRGGSERGGREGSRTRAVLSTLHAAFDSTFSHSVADNVVDVLHLIQHFTLYGPTTFYYYGPSKL